MKEVLGCFWITANCVRGFWAVSDRVLLVKLQGKPLNMAMIVVYAPTAESTDEDIDIFYEQLEAAKSQCKSNEIVIAMGDMNARWEEADMVEQ